MIRRPSLFQHFLGALLFLLVMAYAVIQLNAATAVLVPGERIRSARQAARLQDLALLELSRGASPAAACPMVGPFFEHAALVTADREISLVCAGDVGVLRRAVRRMALPVAAGGEEVLAEPGPFGGGLLHRMVPLRAPSGEAAWFLVSVRTARASWSGVAGTAIWSFLPFLLFAFLLVWWKTRQVAEDVNGLTELFGAFRQGRLQTHVPVSPVRELAALQTVIRSYAEETEQTLSRLARDRNELDAVFSAMTEGVVVLDAAGAVSRMNRSALEMFQVSGQPAGPLIELIRHAGLDALVSGDEADLAPVRRDLHFEAPRPRVLQVHCSRVRNAVGLVTGTLLVFEDVTRLRRLESVRREFSSNVSHELKTPITSILGFIETLRDEEGASTEEERRHYLEIVARQAGRLHAIVEDLLTLSRIELITDPSAAGLEPSELAGVVEAAVGMCARAAQERDIRLEVEPVSGMNARINASLLEQALVNVIDNAIKYSPEGSVVRVTMAASGDELLVEVRDHGIGIPEGDLPHIFERFYRVDKGRSRKAGGTGLGLSIARHIMQVHHGRILVESRPGEGSCFTLALPRFPGD